jgi:carbon-monoxide dehydrogenase medium subunit
MFIRRLPRFEYHAPTSLDEALNLLAQYGSKAKVFAGGTDLFGAMKRREIVADHLINLKGIAGLNRIDHDEAEGLRIGGLSILGDLERSQIVKDKLAILADALNVIASPQIRNLGTIGGNICGAVPSADTVPPLIASGASLKLIGKKEERTVLVEQFFKGRGQSVLRNDEILTRITIPNAPENSGSAYFKLMTRNAMELAIVGVGVHLVLDNDGKTCQQAKIALGAVAPTPIRARAAEEVLNNQAIDTDLAGKAGKVAASEASPISNVRASKEYRMEMIAVLTERAVMQAYQRIQAKSKR